VRRTAVGGVKLVAEARKRELNSWPFQENAMVTSIRGPNPLTLNGCHLEETMVVAMLGSRASVMEDEAGIPNSERRTTRLCDDMYLLRKE